MAMVGHDGVVQVNSSNDTYMSKQGFPYHTGISKETVGASGISMHFLRLPPGGVERAHLHRDHETAIYQISGISIVMYGKKLEHTACIEAGSFVYIPPNVPHLPYNGSDEGECVIVLARTDPNEQESVVLLPELDHLGPRGNKKTPK